MANIQITRSASQNNANSESCIAINPNNQSQIVCASKKFSDITNYDFTLAAHYSDNGGQSWKDSPNLVLPPGAEAMTDPILTWDDSNNVFLAGLTGINRPPKWDKLAIVVYTSANGGQTWSAPDPIHKSTGDDKPWLAGDTNTESPFHGSVYAVWDDAKQNSNMAQNNGIVFARTTDHGKTWTGPGGAPVGTTISTGTGYPEIDVSTDGTIYVVSTDTSAMIKLQVSSDGGNTFNNAAPITGITTLEKKLPKVNSWSEFSNGTFRVIGDPTVCGHGETVLVAWPDYRDGVSRIYYARSVDSGKTWTTGPSGQPLLTGPLPDDCQHFFPEMVVDRNGVFGCAFYEFGPKLVPPKMLIDVILAQSSNAGQSFGHSTVTDQPWDPTVDAPHAHAFPNVTFIGDYMGLDVSGQGFHPVWTDTRTGIQELWTDIV